MLRLAENHMQTPQNLRLALAKNIIEQDEQSLLNSRTLTLHQENNVGQFKVSQHKLTRMLAVGENVVNYLQEEKNQLVGYDE